MKRAHCLAVTSVLVVLLSVRPSECAGQKSTAAQETQLTQIALMFHSARSQQEIVKAWASFFRARPETNVDWALSFLRKEVERTGNERVQQARQRLTSARKWQDTTRNELSSARRKSGATQKSITDLENKFQAARDTAQRLEMELQQREQDSQQVIQTLSAITKQLHDEAMGIIRNIKG